MIPNKQKLTKVNESDGQGLDKFLEQVIALYDHGLFNGLC